MIELTHTACSKKLHGDDAFTVSGIKWTSSLEAMSCLNILDPSRDHTAHQSRRVYYAVNGQQLNRQQF